MPLDTADTIGFDIPWTAVDRATLFSFLETQTGLRLLGQLLTKRPVAGEKSDLNKRAMQSALIEGYEDAVSRIRFFATDEKSIKR